MRASVVEAKEMSTKTNFWWNVVAAIVLQAVVFYLAYKSGVTSRLIPWDECDFIYSGLLNTDLLKSVGLVSALPQLDFVAQPITYVQATLALLLSGNRVSTPYFVNVVYVFLFLYSIGRSLRTFGAVPTLAFQLMAISVPLVFLFASHLKTDYLAGGLAFVMLVELFIVDGSGAGPLARACVLACGVGLCKPAAFYVPGLMCFIFAAHLWREAATGRLDRHWSKSIPQYMAACAVQACVFAAVFAPHFTYFVAYIKHALSPPFVGDFDLREHLEYYLPLPNGDSAELFGVWGPGFLAFIFLGAVFAWAAIRKVVRRDDAVTLVALAAVSGAAYVPIVLSPQLQPPFGSIFGGSVLALFLCAYRALKRSIPRSYLLDCGLIGVSLACFHLPVRQYQAIVPSTPDDIRQASDVLDRFVRDIAEPGAPAEPSLYFNYSPIPYFNLGIRFYLNTGRFPAGMIMPLSGDVPEIRSGVQGSDYVALYDPGTPLGPGDGYWRTMMYTTRDVILKTGNLSEVDRVPYVDGSYVLYRVEKPSG